jgi:hypothetical protein
VDLLGEAFSIGRVVEVCVTDPRQSSRSVLRRPPSLGSLRGSLCVRSGNWANWASDG